MSSVLWFHTSKFTSGYRFKLEEFAKTVELSGADFFYICIERAVRDLWLQKTAKTKVPRPEKKAEVLATVRDYIKKIRPKIIVINDPLMLEYLTPARTTSLSLTRGSVYQFDGLPCIVFDDIQKVNYSELKYYTFVFVRDMLKLKRWLGDEQHFEPKFVYSVINSPEEARNCLEFLRECLLIATDIETGGPNLITSIQYAGLHKDGRVRTFVFPFLLTTREGGMYWTGDIEIEIWQIVREINDLPVPKTMHGGMYDCAYFIVYNCPPRNYFYDSMYMFWSLYCEAPKKLNFVSSLCLDHVRYWKDDLKASKEDTMPRTEEQWNMYWRYGAADSHYTLLDTLYLAQLMAVPHLAWSRDNYSKVMRLQIGPGLWMSMQGFKTDQRRLKIKGRKLLEEREKMLRDLRIMVDDPDFNPESNDQVAQLIYDILGAQEIKTRGKKKYPPRTTDKKVLVTFIRDQHPLIARYIDQVIGTKEPANTYSNYIKKQLGLNGRFHFTINFCGTETGRASSGQSQFWVGRNAQNVPKDMRDAFIADDGYVIFEADYSQSDAYFVAFESGDMQLIITVTDERDTHAVHAEFFFKEPYDKIVAAHAVESDWTDHPITGIRQNSKRIVHGSNFQMQGFTMYMTMQGRDAVVATAHAMGHEDAHLWSLKQLVAFCDTLSDGYYQMYPGLPTWFTESAEECHKNGNRATCAFGLTRIFFGDILHDNAVQRELSSFYGQGGTSGNINRSLLELYYESDLRQKGMRLMTETHDSITVQVPIEKLELCNELLTIMERRVIIKGREFIVPAEGKMGLSWGPKSMVPWISGKTTIEEIRAKDKEWHEEHYEPFLTEADRDTEDLIRALDALTLES